MTSSLCFLLLTKSPERIIDWRRLESSSAVERNIRSEIDRLVMYTPYPRQGSLIPPFESALKAAMANTSDDKALLRATLIYGYSVVDGAFVRESRYQWRGQMLEQLWGTRNRVRSYEMVRAYMLLQAAIYGSDRFGKTDYWIRLTEFQEEPWTVALRCNSRVWAENRRTDRTYQRSKRDFLYRVPFCAFFFRHSVTAINVSDAVDRKDKVQMKLAIQQIRALIPLLPPDHPGYPASAFRTQANGLEKLIQKW